MNIKTIVNGFILFMMFLIGYSLFAQTPPTSIPKNGGELFFYICIIIASALGRNVDKLVEKLINYIPNPKLNPTSKRKSDV